MKVGINGMGRIGRLAFRAALGGISRVDNDPNRDNTLDIVHVNELKGGIAATAHLLEFDSIHGRWRTSFGVNDEQSFEVGSKRIGFSDKANPADVPWGDIGCDIVLECTGKFLSPDQLQGYFDRGVKKVIVASRSSTRVPSISSLASTTNCTTPQVTAFSPLLPAQPIASRRW